MGHRAAFRGGQDAESGRVRRQQPGLRHMQRGLLPAQFWQLLRPRAIAENL